MDPVHRGDNHYGYPGYPGDPVNQYDLDGKRWSWKRIKRFVKRNRVIIASFTAGFACGVVTAGIAAGACGVIAGGLAGAGAEWYWNRKASRRDIALAGVKGMMGYGGGGSVIGALGRHFGRRALRRWAVKYYPSTGCHVYRKPNSHKRKPWWRRW
ncbi:hypothetical protein [Streptomyces sudanensis]|nr:hypothetical protein [Streptomyces sudanensis]MCQ0002539.1 hypothetical protein [Streptomyces sudanensis]